MVDIMNKVRRDKSPIYLHQSIKSQAVMMPLVFCCAFASGADRIINERPDQVVNPIQMGEVVFVDHTLNRTETERSWFRSRKDTTVRVTVVDAELLRQTSGFARVTALFRNHTDFPQVIEVRAQFFDDERRLTEDFTRWQRIVLPANAVQDYAANSINTSTTQYRLEVREAQ
jgi:hypothetical protein